MTSAISNTGRHNVERWRFWRDVLVFELKMFLGNLRDFALIPVSLAAAVIDLVSKGDREGSLFYRVLRWGAHSEEVLDAYSPVKHANLAINPDFTVDAVISRIEGVMVREYEKGGTAASIKASIDRVIDQVQHGTGTHRERVQGAIAKASEKLGGRLRLGDQVRLEGAEFSSTSDTIGIRQMNEMDAEAVTELARELGYPNEIETIRQRIKALSLADLLLVAIDSRRDEVVGFVQAHRVWVIEVGFRVEILGLVVSAKTRRGGIGRRLLAEVEAWAGNVGAEAVVVQSNIKRTESHIFYPATGYAAIKTQAVYEKRMSDQARTEGGFPQKTSQT
jgi:predicted N-acetyltransferase YhbS